MTLELKPCPFCGCPAHRVGGGSSRSGPVAYSVRCVNVLCAVEVKSFDSRTAAEEKWNSRAPQRTAE